MLEPEFRLRQLAPMSSASTLELLVDLTAYVALGKALCLRIGAMITPRHGPPGRLQQGFL